MKLPTSCRPPIKEAPPGKSGFEANEARKKFVKTVIYIYGMHIAAMLVMGYAFFTFGPSPGAKNSAAMAALDAAGFLSILCFWLLMCCVKCRRSSRSSAIVYGVFVNATAYGLMFKGFTVGSWLLSMVASVLVGAGAAYWTRNTQKDITGRKFITYLVCVEVGGFFLLQFLSQQVSGSIQIQIVLSGIASALMGVTGILYLAVLLQLIMGGRELQLSMKEPIVGAILVFAGIHRIFNTSAAIYFTCCEGGQVLVHGRKDAPPDEEMSTADSGAESSA